MKKIKILLYTLLFLIPCQNTKAFVLFDINNDDVKQIHILFDDIYYVENFKKQNVNISDINDREQEKQISKNKVIINKLVDTIKEDLGITKLFSMDERSTLENKIQYYAEAPDFGDYKGIDALIKGEFDFNDKGELELKIILWDLLDERQGFGKIYGFEPENYKKVAHIIADEIYKNLTGEERGFFNSRIVYVAESGSVKKRDRKLVIIDFDGSNRKEITYKGKNLVTPLFSRINYNNLLFVGYGEGELLKTFILDTTSGLISQIEGIGDMTFSPNYNPIEENSIVLSATNDGITDIYSFDLLTRENNKLTNSSSIDTTPSYSPDGEHIVFCSDREGSQKLYVMDSDGANVNKITKSRGLYSKPSWSPDGKLIAFVKIIGGKFSIGVVTPNGNNERILVNAYSLDGVRWSPNGRYLIYSKQLGAYGAKSIPHLYIIDILTGHEYRIPTPLKEGASDPDWISM